MFAFVYVQEKGFKIMNSKSVCRETLVQMKLFSKYSVVKTGSERSTHFVLVIYFTNGL